MDSLTILYLASVLSNTLRARRSGGKGKGGRSSGGYSQRAGGRRRGERRPKQRRRPGRVGDPATSDPPRRRPARVHLKRRRAGEKRGTHRRQVLERRRGRWVAGGEGGELRAAARAFGTFRSGGWWFARKYWESSALERTHQIHRARCIFSQHTGPFLPLAGL